MLKYSLLALLVAASLSEAVVLSYSESDGGRILVETAGGDPMSGGSLFIGSYSGTEAPSLGISFSDVEANFSAFAQLTPEGSTMPTESNSSGIFATGEFDGVLDGFEGEIVYMLIIDSLSINSASEFAFLGSSSDSTAWSFPNDSVVLPTGRLSFADVDSYFGGSIDRLFIPAAGATLPSIQLTPVPEPSSLFLVGAGVLGFLRRRR